MNEAILIAVCLVAGLHLSDGVRSGWAGGEGGRRWAGRRRRPPRAPTYTTLVFTGQGGGRDGRRRRPTLSRVRNTIQTTWRDWHGPRGPAGATKLTVRSAERRGSGGGGTDEYNSGGTRPRAHALSKQTGDR